MRMTWAIGLSVGMIMVVGVQARRGGIGDPQASAGQAPAAQAAPAPANIDEYVKLARTGIQQEKSQIIGSALELDATQAAAFWPVYKKYEAELAAIGDERYAGIKDYAAHYGTLTPEKATELTDKAISLEEKRLALIKRYVGEFRSVLPPQKAGRWYQVEMALNRIVDLRLAAEVPLAK